MNVLAVHAEKEYIKVVSMSFRGKRMRLLSLHELKKELHDFEPNQNDYIASALPMEDLFLRRIDFPLKSFSAVKKALPFEMESFVSPGAQVALEMKKIGEGIRAHLYSFREDALEKHVQEMVSIGYDPDWVTSVSLALKAFASKFIPLREDLVIFHFGWEESYVLYLKQGEIEGGKTLKIGFKHLIDSIEMKRFQSDEFSPEFLISLLPKEPFLQKEISKITQELGRVLDSFKRGGAEGTLGIAYTGYADIIQPFFEQKNHFELEEVEITPHLEFKREETAAYAIPIGIAITASDEKLYPLQFRKGKRASPRVKKEQRRGLLQLALCNVTLLLLAFGGFQLLLAGEQKKVDELFLELSFSKECKTLQDLKKEYKKRKEQNSLFPDQKKVRSVLEEISGPIEKIEYHSGEVEIVYAEK